MNTEFDRTQVGEPEIRESISPGLQLMIEFARSRAEQRPRVHGNGWTHAEGMIDLLEQDEDFAHSPAHRLAIGIHDLVTTGSRSEEDLDHEFITRYVEQLSLPTMTDEDQAAGLYALGVAVSRVRLESRLEEWRARFADYRNTDHLDATDMAIYNDLIRTSLQERPGEPIDDARIERTKHAISQALFDGGAEVTTDLLRFRLPMNILHLMDLLEEHDLDAFRVGGAEFWHNMRFPNPARPAAQWRDAIEGQLLSYVLQIMGDNRLASYLRSQAMLYLNHDSEHFEAANRMHEEGEQFMKQNREKLHDVMHEAYLKTSHRFGLMDGNRTGMHFSERVKLRGATLEKLGSSPKYAEDGTIPDVIGAKGRIADLPAHINKPEFMFYLGIECAKDLQKANMNLQIGHTHANEHTVEINYGSHEEVRQAVESITAKHDTIRIEEYEDEDGQYLLSIPIRKRKSGKEDGYFHVTIGPARKSKLGANRTGYQAVHVSAVYNQFQLGPRVGAEIRFTEASVDENNERGDAADYLYRAGKTIGPLGDALREGDMELANMIIERSKHIVSRIHDRTRLLQQGTNLWLHPQTVSTLSYLGNSVPGLTSLLTQHYRKLYPEGYEEMMPTEDYRSFT